MLHTENPRTAWWREPEVFWLILLIGVTYFARMTTLELRGEETRRAQVAFEMLESGDWIVPRLQGELYRTRPPLGNWLIAIGGLVRGKVDAAAIRLPTLIAVLVTTLLIYGYARNHLTRLGATAAAVAYATMGQVLQIGRLAESEGVFTLFIASSLLVWRWGWVKRWPVWLTWSSGYALAALAGLTKGPQGPVYFVLPVMAYLLWRRDWRSLFSWGHAAGITTFACVIAGWQVPYVLQTNYESGVMIWTQQASNRFSAGMMPLLLHLATYPLKVLACMLPWSLALMHLGNRRFRGATRALRDELVFLGICVGITFPSVWLAVSAEPRYFMPMYPIVAIICGTVIDRSIGRDMGMLHLGWKSFLVGCGLVAVTTATAMCLADSVPGQFAPLFAQPDWFRIPNLVFSVVLFVFLAGTSRSAWRMRHQVAVLAIGFGIGVAYCGAAINAVDARERDVAAAVAGARRKLPTDATLVSFGHIDHAFLYHYGAAIPRRDWPADAAALDADYFCFRARDRERHQLPFEWEEVAVVSLKPSDSTEGRREVVIGRRLPLRTARSRGPQRH